MEPSELRQQRTERAARIAQAGNLDEAITSGAVPLVIDTTLAEAVVLGLLRQGVTRFLCVLGHGSTEIGEVLRIYEEQGLVRSFAVRSEVEASHAAVALRWVTGERAAVVTSIGPGAMHALAGSLAAASNGLGIWYLFGDETTHDEGPNMQQVPKREQGLFLRICATMGAAYSLHTPLAVGTALRRGLVQVDDPVRAGPFFLLLPLNTQPAALPGFHLDELPRRHHFAPPAAAPEAHCRAAVEGMLRAERVVVKVGAGARHTGLELEEFLELIDGVAVLSPQTTGVLPYHHPRNMLVGGSKGTLCGNYAMENADLLVALGTRAVCQSDCSRTGYPGVEQVVNINPDRAAAVHYARTVPLVGDAAGTLQSINRMLQGRSRTIGASFSSWVAQCATKRREWEAYKAERYACPLLSDEMWGGTVLTQPAAIKLVTDWARERGAVTFFDAGDVQANGFQVVEDDRIGRTYTETGASYMGFAASALLASGLAPQPFFGVALSGDGSFMMNPQVLIDGVEHKAWGCVVLLDNRRMGAISSLQREQYGQEYATWDGVEVDYVALAGAVKGVQALDGGRIPDQLRGALEKAYAHDGLTVIHVPVYYGPDPLGGLGSWGRWNVGNWVDDVQQRRHDQGL